MTLMSVMWGGGV